MTSVIANGRDGVLRLQTLDLESSDMDIRAKLLHEVHPLQPEWNNEFVLIELTAGMCKYYLSRVFFGFWEGGGGGTCRKTPVE